MTAVLIMHIAAPLDTDTWKHACRGDHTASSVFKAWLSGGSALCLVCANPDVDLCNHCLPHQQDPGLLAGTRAYCESQAVITIP